MTPTMLTDTTLKNLGAALQQATRQIAAAETAISGLSRSLSPDGFQQVQALDEVRQLCALAAQLLIENDSDGFSADALRPVHIRDQILGTPPSRSTETIELF